MTISDVLLDGNSHLRHISTMGDGQGGGWGLKFEEVRGDVIYLFFSICVFFHEHPRITGLQGK